MSLFPLHKPDFWCFSEAGPALGEPPRMVFMTKDQPAPIGSFYFNETGRALFESLAGVVEAMRPKFTVPAPDPGKGASVRTYDRSDGSQGILVNLVRANGNSIHEFNLTTRMTGRDFVNKMREWLDHIDPPVPAPPPSLRDVRRINTGDLSATLGTFGEALTVRAGRDDLVTLWPKDGPTGWAESFRAAAEKLNPSGPPPVPRLGEGFLPPGGPVEMKPGEVVALPAPTPNREQQKAAWAFVGATLRLAQANLRDGFDKRMIEAAQVMCEANERAS